MFSPYGNTKRCYDLKATMQRKQEPHGFGITMTIVSVTTSYTVVCASLPKPSTGACRQAGSRSMTKRIGLPLAAQPGLILRIFEDIKKRTIIFLIWGY